MNTKLAKELLELVKQNPNPSDKLVHDWAEKKGLEPDFVEEQIYKLLSGLLSGGKSKGKDIKVNPKELKMGMKVETEHTSNKFLARKIAIDHLVEISDYYTRLLAMEKQAEKEGVKKSQVQPYIRTRHGHLEHVSSFFRKDKDYKLSDGGVYKFLEDNLGMQKYGSLIQEEAKLPGTPIASASANALLRISDEIGVPVLGETMQVMGGVKYSKFLKLLFDRVSSDVQYIRNEARKSVK